MTCAPPIRLAAAPTRRLPGRRASVVALLLLAGCGGGVSIGFGTAGGVSVGVGGTFGDALDRTAPSVSLTTAAASVQAGRSIRLAAAAADESGIESVSFARLDGDTPVVLATLGAGPYEIETTAPTDGRSTVAYFARATDNEGNRADSARVLVTVTP